MCGFVGCVGLGAWCRNGRATSVLNGMANAIVSRGPDDSGIWFDAASGIGLAHRRLSILDLSNAGHQPMMSADGRYVIAFNGEIYNHLGLRRELDHMGLVHAWRGSSDTETLLTGMLVWGVKSTIQRCVGMFAFALWDRKEQVLTLGRDRLGEKPLYYGWQGTGESAAFLFGSEVTALKSHPSFMNEINRGAISLLMRYNYIPAPHSIYKGIFKLQAGKLLTVSLAKPEPVIEEYWSLPKVAMLGVNDPFEGTEEQVVDELETLLKSAVRQQMVADVPLGAFLSGGIDSSTIVALMQAQSSFPVKTFSIGFHEKAYNEADHAKAVARHLGTDHNELYITARQALDVIPNLPSLYSEPFADSSQIPTFLISQLARKKVTVALTGDAGDELFSGYSRYVLTEALWGKISRLPSGIRTFLASGILALSPSALSRLLVVLGPLLPQFLRKQNLGSKLHKGGAALKAKSFDDFYLALLTHWDPAGLVIGGTEPETCLQSQELALFGLDNTQRMMVLDSLNYLPDDILTKIDRAAMGVSLEGRVPFLDHRVVEFAWRIPQSMKLRNGVSKWVLRQVLYRYAPKELVERPKMGFAVPIDSWLRGPLRDWAEALLDESRLRQEGFFYTDPIRKKWSEHLSGQHNWQYQLWNVLMFQAWLRDYKE